MRSIKEYEGAVLKLSESFALRSRQHAEERATADAARVAYEASQAAQAVSQDIAQSIQEQAHDRIASVVTRCLETVFDDPYEFRIVFEQKRGKTEARLAFVRGDMQVDPMTAAGGGVVDVAAFALRVAALVLSRPQLRRLLIMDEPFRFVSAGYRPRVAALLRTLAEEMGVQFVLVTHFDDLASEGGVVVDLG